MAETLDNTGAEETNRTPDLLITNQLLYQLSYFGISDVKQLKRKVGILPGSVAFRNPFLRSFGRRKKVLYDES